VCFVKQHINFLLSSSSQQQQQVPQTAPKSNPFSGVNSSLLRGFDSLKEGIGNVTGQGGGGSKPAAGTGVLECGVCLFDLFSFVLIIKLFLLVHS
jgi:hypothetical protein